MLESLIIQEIEQKGPMTQARFMELALSHPQYGYYRNQEAVSRDFTTASEISQMFGELIGIWVLDWIQKNGGSDPITLVELGPGRGTLMSDILRVTSKVNKRLDVIFVETNPRLKEIQAHKIKQARWVEDFQDIPKSNTPMIIIANEFFDVFPTHSYLQKEGILYERCLQIAEGKLHFYLQRVQEQRGPDRCWEKSPQGEMIFQQICSRFLEQTGVLLMIDYGYERGEGDSLQAIYKGDFSDPLTHVGCSDLTCHVNFGRLNHLAQLNKMGIAGPISQREYLLNMGIMTRLHMLKKNNPPETQRLEKDVERLIHPFQMGLVFKVMSLFSPQTIQPLGFNK